MKVDINKIAASAVIAALYVALTLLFLPIGFGAVQFRVSEALCVLPFCMPLASVGLFVGCLISNIIGSATLWDIIFGSLATLFAALTTAKMKRAWLAPVPPIVWNGLIVGAVLAFTVAPGALGEIFPSLVSAGLGSGVGFWRSFPLFAGSVAVGEAVVGFVLGIPLLLAVQRVPIFKPFLREGAPMARRNEEKADAANV